MRAVRLGGIFAVLLLLVAGKHAFAEERRDNTLTPHEIAEGWLLLFDGETDFGWRKTGATPWKISEGMMQVSDGSAGVLSATTEFADYELKAQVWVDNRSDSGLMLRCPLEGDITASNSCEVNFLDPESKIPNDNPNVVIKSHRKANRVNQWISYDITLEGDHLTVKVDGIKRVDSHRLPRLRGTVAIRYGGAGTVRCRNLILRPLKMTTLFNGKDLTGWHIVPDHKSIFTVQNGAINIKNGNGDIQTETEYGDFVFQTEVFCNGEHPNSGIFYRANKGEFEIGYEDQIRNQWEGEDRSKPVDFGTGAIYRRQAVRKVVSSDHEWFTMTLAAHGLHFASWVNGYLVADFTDTRPPDETNARKGARTRPGVLSFQGHDPTTDISFRNVRVQAYPPLPAR